MSNSSVLITMMSSGKPVTVDALQIEALDSEIERVEAERASCSGLESGYANSLIGKTNEARAEKSALDRLTKWSNPVSIIDLTEAMSWRDASGLPRVAVFNVEDPTMFLEFRYYREIPSKFSKTQISWWSLYNARPGLLHGNHYYFNDLGDRWKAECEQLKIGFRKWFRIAGNDNRTFKHDLSVYAYFRGVISSQMRSSIDKARKIFGATNVYVIAEVPKWHRPLGTDEATAEITGAEFLLVAMVNGDVLLLDASGFGDHISVPPSPFQARHGSMP